MVIPKTRIEEWREFSKIVENHILSYTINQYNDKGNDQATNYSIKTCLDNTKRYINRYGKNIRKNQELLDMKKMVHYICIAYWKEVEKKQTKNLLTKILNYIKLVISKIFSNFN